MSLCAGIIHCVKSVRIQFFTGPCFPVFGLNTGKFGPGKAPYLETFYAVISQNNLEQKLRKENTVWVALIMQRFNITI